MWSVLWSYVPGDFWQPSQLSFGSGWVFLICCLSLHRLCSRVSKSASLWRQRSHWVGLSFKADTFTPGVQVPCHSEAARYVSSSMGFFLSLQPQLVFHRVVYPKCSSCQLKLLRIWLMRPAQWLATADDENPGSKTSFGPVGVQASALEVFKDDVMSS